MKERLDALLAGLEAELSGDPATQICDVACDSRAVGSGALFVALRGAQTDGHRFVAEAASRGAAALLVEEVPPDVPDGVALAVVRDTRRVFGEVAARVFDHPARDMSLVGVTGTNGKTSTVRLLESIFATLGRRVGSVGTVSVRWPGAEEMAGLTTPDPAELQRTLARMRAAGVDTAVLEVSSHSLEQHRVEPLRFEAAVFTNLTQDHLDYHGEMESYARAKARLFGEYLDGVAVLNAADPYAETMREAARRADRDVVSFARGTAAGADVRTLREDVRLDGARLEVDCRGAPLELELRLPGDFQVENALAAVATAAALEVPAGVIARGVAACEAVPGRLERVGTERPVVFVDYAHTPDALDRVLGRVRPFVTGRLIVVFGCGGDRDRRKREPMARAACAHGDHVIATSDNPRTEDPEEILRDVARGLSGAHEIVADRRSAIARAVAMAEPDDVIVIAGKGHEDYQIVGTERRPFDDRVEARAALLARAP